MINEQNVEIGFYQVAAGNLVPVAIRLLEKIFLAEQRSLFFSPLADRIQALDKSLWTFSQTFIPHGDRSLGFASFQDIYLTSEYEDNPNNASVLMMADSFDYQKFVNHEPTCEACKKKSGDGFQRIVFVFENSGRVETTGNIDFEKNDHIKEANLLYEDLKKNVENVNYWKQTSKGWEKLL